MFINKLKKAKVIDMYSKLSDYIIKNFSNESLIESIKAYFAELASNRFIVSIMEEVQDSKDQLKENINIITLYINKIMFIIQNIKFGKECDNYKIEFIWNDTIKGNISHSYNIWFEIYNVLYNLAVSYYCLASYLAKLSTKKDEHKEATNYFKNSLYIFNLIKEEATNKIPKNELPIDLYPGYLSYYMYLYEIQGNLEIYKIAKEACPKELFLHSKLALAISNLYKKARSLSNELETKDGFPDYIIQYLENRVYFYKSVVNRDLRDGYKKKLDECGEGYGEMILHQDLLIKSLLDCQKNITKCGKFVDIEQIQKEINEE